MCRSSSAARWSISSRAEPAHKHGHPALRPPFHLRSAQDDANICLDRLGNDKALRIRYYPRVPQSPLPGVTVIDHPLIRVKMTQLRDAQTASVDFRARLNELATLMVFEATRDLVTRPIRVRTPLAETEGAVLVRPIVVAPILRAGLGLVEGMLDLLPDVSVAHIGMFRNEETRRPESYYFKAPAHLAEADVILVDPMLATGWSATAAVSQLKEAGATSIRFVCLVSCVAGVKQLHGVHPDVPIFTSALDPDLNECAYIVPGLGDAGDRYFGTA